MKATRFMRQPFIVTGYQVHEEDMDAIAKWCQGHVIRNTERPFIRVPVDRPTNRKQTEAYLGTWVLLFNQRGENSFKVYTPEWLEKNFFQLPPEIEDKEENEPTVEVTADICCVHDRIGSNVRALPVQSGGNKILPNFRAAP